MKCALVAVSLSRHVDSEWRIHRALLLSSVRLSDDHGSLRQWLYQQCAIAATGDRAALRCGKVNLGLAVFCPIDRGGPKKA
jgi:hypothetical protein